MMNVKINAEAPVLVGVSIVSIAMVLNEYFNNYTQASTVAEMQEVKEGLVILPIMQFEPKVVYLKSNAIKNTLCEARLITYSSVGKDKECIHLIHARKYTNREETFKKMPVPVREAKFDVDGETAISDLLITLGAIPADKVSFYYNACACEGVTSHCFAVIHEFIENEKAYCVVTSHFKIEVGK